MQIFFGLFHIDRLYLKYSILDLFGSDLFGGCFFERIRTMKIAICGSMQYAEKMMEAAEQLKALGHEGVVPATTHMHIGRSNEESEVIKLKNKVEANAIKEHWKVIQVADAVLVLNYDKHGIVNYIGGNTFLEMGFGYVLEKKIFLLNPIPEMPYYKTELDAMKPIVLNGDLSLLK